MGFLKPSIMARKEKKAVKSCCSEKRDEEQTNKNRLAHAFPLKLKKKEKKSKSGLPFAGQDHFF